MKKTGVQALKAGVMGVALLASSAAFAGKVTLTSQGTISVKPDLAHINIAVETSDESAKSAVKANSEKMEKVLDALKKKGIEEKSIQTTNFYVQPQYEKAVFSGQGKVIGYRVVNTVRITTDIEKKLGEILDNVIDAGANRISGISFGVSNADKLLDEARRNAMKNAQEKVKLYAEAAGAEVGKVISISENNASPEFRNVAYTSYKSRGSVPIQSGSQNLTVNVTVTWELK